MNTLTISTSFPQEVTIISNIFLDKYMPSANGEFVKIYLFLLRVSEKHDCPMSLSSIADTMSCTEKDVLRALKYWAKQGILSLSFDEGKKLTGIQFQNYWDTAPQSDDPQTDTADTPSAPIPQKKLTAAKIRELKSNDQIVELLFIAEQYLGKTLTRTDTERILYFYDSLKMSSDLIEYLIEYCVSRDHRSMRYIETVALAWHEDGITTVDAAKKSVSSYRKEYYAILKALGISGRNPIDAEITIMDTWFSDYGFSMDIITEACTRTVMKTKQPNLNYTDKILASWHAAGVHTTGDIAKLDQIHTDTQKPAAPAVSKKGSFSNIEKRTYDFDELEKHLLN